MTERLAIEGGVPVRQRPFPAWPVFGDAERDALLRVLDSGRWGKLAGNEVAAFEKTFADYHGAKHGIGVVNGTVALRLALLAAGIEAGDEVIVPPYTFLATASAVVECNATPIFADIQLDTFNLDPAAVEEAITPRTRAIIPVHLGGLPVDLDAILALADRHGLTVIEDAAHAHGSEYQGRRVGALGQAGTFSFQSSKNLSSGEGGIILTNDDAFADRCWSAHNCGRRPGRQWYEHFTIGGNYRLGEFQGAVLNAQWMRFEEQCAIREENGKHLAKRLSEIPGVHPQYRGPDCTRHAYHIFVFRIDPEVFGAPRDRIVAALQAEGIPCMAGYVTPLYRQDLFERRNFGPYTGYRLSRPTLDYSGVCCPKCEAICYRQGVMLEHRLLLGSQQDMDDIAAAMARVYRHRSCLHTRCRAGIRAVPRSGVMEPSSIDPHATMPIATRWRRIQTPIPEPESISAIERLRKLEPRSMTAMPPILWHEAEGFCVRDPHGNQWIDLTSGIVMANVGHSHPRIAEALHRAVDEQLLATYAFPTEVRAALLAKLVALAPFEDAKAIVYCAGTEVTECAMALMRRRGQSIATKKVSILSFADGYHGRTLSASLAGGRQGPNDWITREKVGHYQIPFPFCPRCPWGRDSYDNCGGVCFRKGIETLTARGIQPEQIAGFIGEAVPGWATWPIPTDFAQAMRNWATEHDILITFDEVQCGCARTGRFFGFEHTGITPDLITLGKGLTSSVPVSALIGPAWLMDLPAPGEMSSTHGGNPVCAAAAVANLGVIEDEQLVDRAATTGTAVLERLRQLQCAWPQYVRSVHGPGLFISIHLQVPGTGEPHTDLADALVAEVVRRGVLMFPTSRGFVKFVPPLCIELEAALEAVNVIRESLADLCRVFAAPRTRSDAQ